MRKRAGQGIFLFSLFSYALTVPAFLLLIFFSGMGPANSQWIGIFIGLALVLSNAALTFAGVTLMNTEDPNPQQALPSEKITTPANNKALIVILLLFGSLCVMFIWGFLQHTLKEFEETRFYYLSMEDKIKVYDQEIKKNKKVEGYEESPAMKRGKLHYALSHYTEAARDFEMALAEKKYEDFLSVLLMAYLQLGEKEKAFAALKDFYSERGNQGMHQDYEAAIFYYFGDYQEAAARFKIMLSERQTEYDYSAEVMRLLISLGNCYAQLGNDAEAETFLTQAVNHMENAVKYQNIPVRLAEPYIARGEFFVLMGQYKRAAEDLNQGVSIGDYPNSALWEKSFLEYQLGHDLQAAQDIMAFINSSGDRFSNRTDRETRKFLKLLLEKPEASSLSPQMQKILHSKIALTEDAVWQDANFYLTASMPLFSRFEDRFKKRAASSSPRSPLKNE